MPLKVVERKGAPSLYIRGTVGGREIFISAKTADRKQAERKRIELEHALEHEEKVTDEKYFFEAIESYIESGGQDLYLGKINDTLGMLPLSEVNQEAIDKAARDAYKTFVNPGKKTKQYSASTINRQFYVPVAAILHHAHDLGWIPYIRVKKRKEKKTTPKWATPEWMEKFRETANHRIRRLVVFLAYTGCRISEALNLEWKDVNLKEKTAFVRTTKNGEPRMVYLPDEVIEEIQDLPKKGRVFSFYRNRASVNHAIARACKAAKIEYLSSHQVGSHTYATWMRRYSKLDQRGLIATGRWKNQGSTYRYTHATFTEEASKAEGLPRAKNRAKHKKDKYFSK